MRSVALATLVFAAVSTSCARLGGSGGPNEAGTPSPLPGGDIAADCDTLEEQVPRVMSPTPTDRHTPAHGGGELLAWGQTQAPESFGGLWHLKGVPVMAFTERVDAYRRTVHDRFTDDIVVVGAERTRAELAALEDRIRRHMQAQRQQASRHQRRFPEPGTISWTSIRDRLGRVQINVYRGDEAALADISARYGPDRICLELREPPRPPDLDGPVRRLAKAEGWRDGVGGVRAPEAVLEIAADRSAAEAAWAANVPDDLPREPRDPAGVGVFATLADVDFDQEAVVVWSARQSPGCPGWLADVITDADGTVHLDTESVATTEGCSPLGRPYRMVLAVDRDRLPEPSALPTEATGPLDARVTVYSP